MELNKIYKYIDAKYSPIIGYLSIRPLQEIKDLLLAIKNKSGIMYDCFGFEYEENNSLTFYDFTSEKEKTINMEVYEILNFIEPVINDFLTQNPNEGPLVKNILKEINIV